MRTYISYQLTKLALATAALEFKFCFGENNDCCGTTRASAASNKKLKDAVFYVPHRDVTRTLRTVIFLRRAQEFAI